jgi:hypothetical protein
MQYIAVKSSCNNWLRKYATNPKVLDSIPGKVINFLDLHNISSEHLSDLVITVPGYKPRGLRFDSRRYQILGITVSLELGPFGLARINEELKLRSP